MKYHALLFLKKQQNFYLSSAANYRWHFKCYFLNMPFNEIGENKSLQKFLNLQYSVQDVAQPVN